MDSRYKSVPSEYEKKPVPQTEEVEGSASTQRQSLSCLPSLVTQLLGLLWLAPITLLLYLNFKSHVTGPSVLCPSEGCKSDPLAEDNYKRRLDLSLRDHNILGALQLVAKFLEFWFVFVAVNLVYSIAMLIASREGGLPIGLFSSSVEFARPRSLYGMFQAVSISAAHSGEQKRHLAKLELYCFVLLLVFMFVLVNLMGPAVAVLVLPTLQWVSLPLNAQHGFNASAIGGRPSGADFEVFPSCSNADLTQRRYSCTSLQYASSLDALVESMLTSMRQAMFVDHPMAQAFGVSAEGGVSFTFNYSTGLDSTTLWTPSRQTLREISADFDYFIQGSQDIGDNPGYRSYNQSLNTVLKRTGPIFGASTNIYSPDNTTITRLGLEKEVHCYGGYFYLGRGGAVVGNLTKCLRVGTAWNHLNKEANFRVAAAHDSSMGVKVFFSDQAAYFDGAFTSDLISSSCFTNGTINSSDDCDFDAIFSFDRPADSSDFTSNIMNVELSMTQKNPSQKIVMEFFTFTDFSTYTLDTSAQTNPLCLVQVNDAPDVKKRRLRTIPVDPDWFLAAWSVDQEGYIAKRSASIPLIQGFKSMLNFIHNITSSFATSSAAGGPLTSSAIMRREGSFTSATLSSNDSYDFIPTTTLSETQYTSDSGSAFLIPIASLSPSTDETSENVGGYNFRAGLIAKYGTYTKTNLTQANQDTKDPHHPTLWYWASVHVWAYRANSRTSKLGIVVTTLGGVRVIVSTVLGLGMRQRRQRTITELLIAAVEHIHQGEMDHGVGKEASKMKKGTRYGVSEDGDGKIRFKPL